LLNIFARDRHEAPRDALRDGASAVLLRSGARDTMARCYAMRAHRLRPPRPSAYAAAQ